MILIEWSEALSVGNKDIDDDHKKIILLINRLYTDIVKKKCSVSMHKAMSNVYAFIKEHFSREEAYFMAKTDYPLREVHKQEHEKMLRDLDEVYVRYLAQQDDFETLDLITFLCRFYNHHIQHMDQTLYGLSEGIESKMAS